jgi:hypothetical protein
MQHLSLPHPRHLRDRTMPSVSLTIAIALVLFAAVYALQAGDTNQAAQTDRDEQSDAASRPGYGESSPPPARDRVGRRLGSEVAPAHER